MDDTSALVPGAHRAIRLLDGRESAFAGELVIDGEQLRVRMDAADAAPSLWDFASAEHVAGVRDVVRRRVGMDVLLPWCTDPVDVFLGRRAAAESPLTTGETVTLVGSLLRGVAETEDDEVRGRWWLTDDARPVFVPGEGSACAAASGEIIARVRETCTDRALERLLTEIGAATGDRRAMLRAMERWERELTELAAPRALEREVYAPERVSAIPLHRARLPEDIERLAEHPGLRRIAAERMVQLVERVRERIPRRSKPVADRGASPHEAGRGRMLLVGAAAAGVVLIGGLLWPTGGEDSSATESIVAGERVSAVKKPAPSAAEEPAKPAKAEDAETSVKMPKSQKSASDPEEPIHTTVPKPGDGTKSDAGGSVQQSAARLLDVIAACAERDDARCEKAVVEGAGAVVLQRVGDSGADREITPIEDYGDIAVLRLGPSDGQGEQMLVLVRHDDGWLVRDVYDVVDQPSGEG